MSYAVSKALQSAIYQALAADAGVAAMVGAAVFDAVPGGEVPDLYVTLGPEDVVTRSDSSGSVTEHRLTISVVGQEAGFARLKDAAGAVSDRLDRAGLTLERGRLVGIAFHRARARKNASKQERRIDMSFRAIVEDI